MLNTKIEMANQLVETFDKRKSEMMEEPVCG